MFTVGDNVKVIDTGCFTKCVWWPDGVVTGQITQMHKNGKITVAIDGRKSPKKHGKRYCSFLPAALALAKGE